MENQPAPVLASRRMYSPHQPVVAAYSCHHRPRVTPATDRRNQARGCSGDPRLLGHRHRSRGALMDGRTKSRAVRFRDMSCNTDIANNRRSPRPGLSRGPSAHGLDPWASTSSSGPAAPRRRRGCTGQARARGPPGGCSTRIFQYSDVVSKSEPDGRGRHAVIRCLTIAREHAPPVTIATERIMPGRPTPHIDEQSEPMVASTIGMEARP